MSGGEPRLVADRAGAFAPNTLHIVRMRKNVSLTAQDLAVVWHSGVTALSCEVEGHSLGGGLLKLEPKEAQKILIPIAGSTKSFCDEVDRLVRQARLDEASTLVDERVASETGLSLRELRVLREGAALLRGRRQNR